MRFYYTLRGYWSITSGEILPDDLPEDPYVEDECTFRMVREVL